MEQVETIRALLERAPIYRAVSVRAALVGGLASLSASIWMLRRAGVIGSSERVGAFSTRDFIEPWLVVFLITCGTNIFFLWRAARRDRPSFFSAGSTLAWKSISPSLLIAAAVTFIGWRNPSDLEGPTIMGLTWMGCYGVALLSTMTFAPRSLLVLGGSFVFASVFWLLILSSPALPPIEELRGYVGANFAMGLTFGFFHLIYAAFAWRPDRSAPSTLTGG